jgi:hypothetical protein
LAAGALALILCHPGAGVAQSTGSQYFETRSMTVGRQKHGAAVIGDYLYIFGGQLADGTYTTGSMFASIGPDGQIGAWAPTTPLATPGGIPLTYIGNSVVVRGRIVYVCGGNANDGASVNRSSNAVSMAAQMPDGQLSNWLHSRPFPGPGVQVCAAVTTQTHLYVLGGADDQNSPQRVVYIAPLVEGGLLGEWSRGPDLPQPLWFHMAGVVGNRIYVWGGATSDAGAADSVADLHFAEIRPDGSLSRWQRGSGLPQPIYFSAAAMIDDTLYNFSGRFRNLDYTSDVLFAIPGEESGLSWDRVRASVPLNRYLAPAVDHRRGIIFFPGGRSQDSDVGIQEVFGYRVPRVEAEVAEVFQPAQPVETAQVQPTGPTTPTPPAAGSTSPPPAASPATGSPGPPTTLTAQAGWNSFFQAEIQALRSSKNLLLYFHTPHARICREIEQTVFQNPAFSQVADSHILTAIDAAAERHHAITYGVYRVPTVVITSPQGQPLATFVRDFSLQDLAEAP